MSSAIDADARVLQKLSWTWMVDMCIAFNSFYLLISE
jgi:hypothetical protein